MNLSHTGKIVPHIRPISGRGRFSRNLAEQIQHTAAFFARQNVQVRKIPTSHFYLQVFQYRICCHRYSPFCERMALLLYFYTRMMSKNWGRGKENHHFSKSGDFLMAVCITMWRVRLRSASHLLVRSVLLQSFCRFHERKYLEAV